MLVKRTISSATPEEPGFDQRQLFAAGVEHVRRLAGRVWTDHNLHDPGITILELASFVQTDLCLRASLRIEDLLASATDNAAEMAKQFFTPRRVLTNKPLTALDYRKLLIDLPGVKNAWIYPKDATYYADLKNEVLVKDKPGHTLFRTVTVRGLYGVLIEPMDPKLADEDVIESGVLDVLRKNRNLCEDFVEVGLVSTQWFRLCGELEVDPDADVSAVAANVLAAVQAYLAPPVKNLTLAEMQVRHTSEEIFDGPALECGFIEDAELAGAELRTEIRLSDVISIVMDVEGVLAVRDLLINPSNVTQPLEDRWRVAVEAGKQPALVQDASTLFFYKRNMPASASAEDVAELLELMATDERAKLETPNPEDVPVPVGSYRNVGAYHSLQNHFPAVYGLSYDETAPGDVSRQAKIYQLGAYLLFFDQVMADYCAQLAHAKDLFALRPASPELDRTYFSQLTSFSGAEKVCGATDADLRNLVEDDAGRIERQNRFLDHLSARFAEDFREYAAVVRDTFGADEASLIELKRAFLETYPEVGAARGLGYVYSAKEAAHLWDSENVSGLERRLAALLGIANFKRRDLAKIVLAGDVEVTGTTADQFGFRLRDPASGAIFLSSNKKYATAELASEGMIQAIEMAQLPSSYERKESADGKHFFNVVDQGGEIVARRIEFFDEEADMERAIVSLMAYVQERYGREGMYLIENILLRAESGDTHGVPICVDPNCTDCTDDDPLSYRMQFILPADAGRFRNADFRRFVEETIRAETPAHILPKVCWIDAEDMAAFQKAYRDWLEIRSGASTSGRDAKIRALIALMSSVKNVYPAAHLRGCEGADDERRFILGQTALGSLDVDDE